MAIGPAKLGVATGLRHRRFKQSEVGRRKTGAKAGLHAVKGVSVCGLVRPHYPALIVRAGRDARTTCLSKTHSTLFADAGN